MGTPGDGGGQGGGGEYTLVHCEQIVREGVARPYREVQPIHASRRAPGPDTAFPFQLRERVSRPGRGMRRVCTDTLVHHEQTVRLSWNGDAMLRSCHSCAQHRAWLRRVGPAAHRAVHLPDVLVQAPGPRGVRAGHLAQVYPVPGPQQMLPATLSTRSLNEGLADVARHIDTRFERRPGRCCPPRH